MKQFTYILVVAIVGLLVILLYKQPWIGRYFSENEVRRIAREEAIKVMKESK